MRGTAVSLSLLLVTGCTMQATTRLNYTPAPVNAASVPLKLAVLPLTEGRGPRTYPSTLAHSFILYIPLVPLSRTQYERLDESLLITKREMDLSTPVDPHALFPYAMAAAIADDLRSSHLFASVNIIDDPSQAGDADLILSGRLDSTEFDNNQTNLGLSFPGIILWILPFPYFWQSATVQASLVLQDRRNVAVWHGDLRGDTTRIFTGYGWGAPISSRPTLVIKRYGTNDLGIDPDSFWAYHAESLRSGMATIKPSMMHALAHFH
jgi:hypothetical protein